MDNSPSRNQYITTSPTAGSQQHVPFRRGTFSALLCPLLDCFELRRVFLLVAYLDMSDAARRSETFIILMNRLSCGIVTPESFDSRQFGFGTRDGGRWGSETGWLALEPAPGGNWWIPNETNWDFPGAAS